MSRAAVALAILLTAPAGAARMAAARTQAPAIEKTSGVLAGYQVLAKNCFKCHGESSQLSGLDLRTRDLALKGGKHGPALHPGKAAESRVLRMILGHAKPQMPPTGALPDSDVKAVRQWIQAGAPYPASASAGGDGRWWAFRPVRRPKVPELRDPWIRNPIDAFILARLKEQGLRPSPAADPVTLIRRVTFDLTGLPPTPEDIDAFVHDCAVDRAAHRRDAEAESGPARRRGSRGRSPRDRTHTPTPPHPHTSAQNSLDRAYERLVDRLLASPHYGERWARHWLDLARYAESEGFKADETRPNAWRYRDYAIESFNADKPYDRFIQEQIAGDELWPNDPQALVATGFNRHWADESNARNLSLRRQEILNDITDTVGSTILGLTVGCARCHDHKYDPISQKDYYRLQAFFAAVQPRDDLPLVDRAKLEEHQRKMAAWEQATRELRDRLAALETPYRAKLMKGKRMPFPDDVLEAVDTPPSQRTALQWQLYNKVAPQLEIKEDEVEKAMKGEDRSKWTSTTSELKKFDPLLPPPLPQGIGVTDVGPEAPKVFTLNVGVYDQPMEEVQPGFLSAVSAAVPSVQRPAGLSTTGRRSALARWLTSPENPLTPRVMANRVWQYHFGRGIVPSSSDLGKAGELPTHPELLDWLAAAFSSTPASGRDRAGEREDGGVGDATARKRSHSPTRLLSHSSPKEAVATGDECGWSLKRLHRLIVTSSAYRQASGYRAEAAAKDPEDRLLWRYQRWRLEGEAIRDACLAVAGTLNPTMGGPSVFPELPEGVSTRGGWTVTKDEAERNRRSVYVFVRRNLRYPLFAAFDYPDTHEPCARRAVTNTAPQALMLFNSELALKPAQAMAGRLLREADSPEARVERAYRLAFGRAPETDEREDALRFMSRQTELLRARMASKRPVATPTGMPPGMDPAEGAALVDFCHTLMNANEFLYVE